MKISLEETLKTCTNNTYEQRKMIIKSIMFCFQKNYVSFKNEFENISTIYEYQLKKTFLSIFKHSTTLYTTED